MEWAGSTTIWIKLWEGISGLRSPRPTPGAQTRKIRPENFWLQKSEGIELVKEATGALTVPLWRRHIRTHLLRLTPYELQHQGVSMKDITGIQGENVVSGIWVNRSHCPSPEPSPHRPSRLVPYLRLHQTG